MGPQMIYILMILVYLGVPCTADQQVVYANNSKSFMTLLNDETVSDIVMTGDITLDRDAWSTVVVANRTVKIYGSGRFSLSYNDINEAIIVEEDTEIELHAMSLIQPADPQQIIPGVFSRYRMANSVPWPSLVIMPGAKVLFNQTVSASKVNTPFSAVVAAFSALGIGEDVFAVNSTAYTLRGSHDLILEVEDVLESTKVGSAVLHSIDTTVVTSAIATHQDTESASGAGLSWRQGMGIGIAVGVIVASMAILLCFILYLKRRREMYQRYKETELTS